MPLMTKKVMECDRCGESVEVVESFSTARWMSNSEGLHRIAKDRFLCPSCYRGYDFIVSRCKVEIEDYLSNAE